MSEIKGSLLTIVLAIGVFSIVFGFIMKAVTQSSRTVGDRMEEISFIEPDVEVE